MATIYVENSSYEVNAEDNLLQACLGLGFDLPYFCWHPALGSVGACRQCAVKQFKDEKDTRGRIVMACMTPADNGTRISIADDEAVQFRKSVIEGLMLNHPHDCPVCDEGGECHLQDMTLMTGHIYRRSRFPKRTFRNQDLGPFVAHEMNRCIQCYRCVRYYRDYAGGHDLNNFSIHNTVFFGRDRDGVLESEFAGNLVEVCPTGVFLDKTLASHYTRKWDQQFAPSVCVSCGVGCNTSPGERYGMLRRIVNRYNSEVNGYFLCDRGRYSYEFVNSAERIRHPRGTLKLDDLEGAIGIGSPRASVEANYALRARVGPDNFYSGMSDREDRLVRLMLNVMRTNPAPVRSLREIGLSDAVLILGEDLTNTAPCMALSVRQAARQQPIEKALKLKITSWNDAAIREVTGNEHGPLFIATPNATKLDEIATQAFRAAPDDIARLGFAIARHEGDGAAIAAALRGAKRPLVISGPSLGSEAVIQAAADVALALGTGIALVAPEVNSIGLALLDGRPLGEALSRRGAPVIILENDLYRRAPAAAVSAFLQGASHVVAIDSLTNRTSASAELVLPAGAFAESDGTFVNYEGRAQRFFQVFVPEGEIRESWRWLAPATASLDELTAAAARDIFALARIPEAAPPAAFRIEGEKVPRAPHRYSGRTSMYANIAIHEPKPPADPDSALAYSMEGYPNLPPAPLIPFMWAPRWNSVRALNKYQSEAGRPLPGGPQGVCLIGPSASPKPFNAPPPAFERRDGQWLLVPLHHIFGSEELSMYAPAIASLAPQPYIALNERAGFAAGDHIDIDGVAAHLPVKIAPELPDGVAGLPAGLPGIETCDLPAWAALRRSA
ncbi:MAG: NADH-quinone oxidoreductase subunit NuoG [Acidobacteriota bacterium]